MNLLNQKQQRMQTNNVYDVVLTIIISIVILFTIYTLVPFSHYNIYIIEPQNNING